MNPSLTDRQRRPVRSAHGAHSLPREYFLSPEILDRERSEIFARSWIPVGRDEDWPGPRHLRTRTILGQPIVVLRKDDGGLAAYHNVCRHRGALLVDAVETTCERGVLTCPYHAWSYDLAGPLLGAPNMGSLSDDRRAELGLIPVDLQVWHGFVFIRVASATESLHEFLAPLEARARDWSLADLRRARQLDYVVNANWKLIFENYSECYHCPTVHPALNRLTPYQASTNDLDQGPILGGPMQLADGIASMTVSGASLSAPIASLSNAQQREIAYFTVFPAFFLSLHPDFVMVHCLEPLAVDETRVTCEFYVHPQALAEPGFDPQPAVDFWDMTNRQDWHVCERVQKGAASPAFQPGPYSDLESVVAAFDRHYLATLGKL